MLRKENVLQRKNKIKTQEKTIKRTVLRRYRMQIIIVQLNNFLGELYSSRYVFPIK